MKSKRSGIFGILILMGLLWSCSKETPYSGIDIKISLSTDTLRFDTVFTTLGSATRSIKIYNNRAESILIPNISLSDLGEKFRMNVDGQSGSSIDDIVIPGEDSIYVFIEVTVDPDEPLSISPFIIQEKLLINTGGEISELYLEAWGQNANYLPFRKANGRVSLLSCNLGKFELDDPKPYVIYGVLAVDSCELVIPEGTKIYVHGGVVKNQDLIYNDGLLLILENGKLTTHGTVDNPVIFQGDRLEPEFDNIEGQWAGIRFLPGSTGSIINHTIIKNALIGARVDSTASITLQSCEIYNTASSGVIGYFGNITMTNCLIYNNGGYSFQAVNGGNYEITHSTLVNYFNQNEGIIATNYICTDPLCNETIIVSPLNFKMVNNIVDGNADKEIFIDDIFNGEDPSFFAIELIHNSFKHDEPGTDSILSQCINCIYPQIEDRLFIDLNLENFQLDSLSVALNKGVFLEQVSFDILDQPRNQNNPDLGCYESEF
jgi:hypothetical protein